MMETSQDNAQRNLELAEVIRRACINAAIEGYERAAISGLCHEGAWEAAISAVRMLDLSALLASDNPDSGPRRP
jgi:hypothetical protein